MKIFCVYFGCLALAFGPNLSWAEDATIAKHYVSKNLVLNPSNELPLPSKRQVIFENGRVNFQSNPEPISHWTQSSGDWKQRSENPPPLHGQHYFFAGFSEEAALYQDIPIPDGAPRKGLQFELVAHTRTYKEGDRSRLMVEIHNRFTALITYDSDDMFFKEAWTRVKIVGSIPSTAKDLRVKLMSIKDHGSNNDGYFDNISLRLFSNKPFDEPLLEPTNAKFREENKMQTPNDKSKKSA